MVSISRKKLREWERFAAEKAKRKRIWVLIEELSNTFLDNGRTRNPSTRCPAEILSKIYTLNNGPKVRG